MKICPFMSGTLKKSVKNDPAHYAPTVWDEPNFIDCIEDRCMAWAPAFTIPAMIERIGNAEHHIPPEHREGCCKIIAR